MAISNSKERKIGIILQYAQIFAGIIISLFYTPIMLSVLGKSEYGLYNVASSVTSYLSLITLGFGASYIRFYSLKKRSADKNAVARLNGLYISVFTIMGLICLAAGLVLSFNVNLFYNETYTEKEIEIARILLIILTINMALSFPLSVFSSYIIAQEKFTFQKIMNIVNTVIGPFLTLPILMMGYGSIGMVLVTTVIGLFVRGMDVFFSIRKLNMRISFGSPDWQLLKDIAVFSSAIAINQLVDQLNWHTDKIMLGKLATSTSVAVYAIGSTFHTHFNSFSTAISHVFAPKINEIVTSCQDEKVQNKLLLDIMVKVGRIQFFLMSLIFSGFLFFGRFFIAKWAGEGYENSYYVALLLMGSALIPLIQTVCIEIQRAKNKHYFRTLVIFVMAVSNVIVSYFLIQAYGEIGAALGTTLAVIAGNAIILNLYYWFGLKLDMIHFWLQIAKMIPSMALPIAGGVLMMVFYQFVGLWDFILLILIYTISFCGSVLFFGTSKSEKANIKALLFKKSDSN